MDKLFSIGITTIFNTYLLEFISLRKLKQKSIYYFAFSSTNEPQSYFLKGAGNLKAPALLCTRVVSRGFFEPRLNSRLKAGNQKKSRLNPGLKPGIKKNPGLIPGFKPGIEKNPGLIPGFKPGIKKVPGRLSGLTKKKNPGLSRRLSGLSALRLVVLPTGST